MLLSTLILSLTGSGCSGGTSEEFDDDLGTIGNGDAGEAGGDGSDGTDAGATDAGDRADGGLPRDAGITDAGLADASVTGGDAGAGDDAGIGLDAGTFGDGGIPVDGGASDGDTGEMDAASGDAGSDPVDAGLVDAGPGTLIELDGGLGCDFGSAQSVAGAGTVNLFGQVVYFAGGAELPAGPYRVTYEDGCMKYTNTGAQTWAVHAYADGSYGWWLVDAERIQRLMLPGTVGITRFPEFEACVAANLDSGPVLFDHAGGPLGVWLRDSPYEDNVTGIDGRNPRWRLERLAGGCSP